MTGRRFFIEPEKIEGTNAILEGSDAHHLKNVLRLKVGNVIELLNGKGTIFTARVKNLGKEIDLEIEERFDYPQENPSIHIAQGILKGKKMDFLMQKATELGVNSFHPFASEYSSAFPSANKRKRWQKIMIEACKQCGRATSMEISRIREFSQICNLGDKFEKKIILWENEPECSLQSIGDLTSVNSTLVVIGPEGGFSSEEVDLAVKNGFQSIKMGELTLRAESASFSIMAIIQFLTGKLG